MNRVYSQRNRSRRQKIGRQLIISTAVLTVLVLAAYFGLRRLDADYSSGELGETDYSFIETDEDGVTNNSPRNADTSPTNDDSPAVMSVYHDGQLYVLNDHLRTLLIIGLDDMEPITSGTSRNTSQADLLVVAVLDEADRTVSLLQINRDTMANVPVLNLFGEQVGVRFEQMALAHTYGDGGEESCENTVAAVSDFLYGVPIDNYLALTMGAVSVVNDRAGGVTVTIRDDFSGVDETLVRGETVTLMGDHALTYVRARSGMADDSSNLARMERQREYMSALMAQLRTKAAADEKFFTDTYLAAAEYMLASFTLNELAVYSDALSDYTFTGLFTPEGEARMGETFVEFYADDDALEQLVLDLFFEPSANGN